MSILVGLLKVAALTLVAYAGLLFLLQRKMIYHPRRYGNLQATLAATQPRPEVVPYDVPAAGGAMTAFFMRGPAAGPETPVVVVFGGNLTVALDWDGFVGRFQNARPDVSFYLVDYPGYGANAGAPSRTSIVETLDPAREALARHLGTTGEALARRESVFGHSLGAAAALEYASRNSVRSVVLFAPFTTLQEMAARVAGRPFHLLLLDRFDNRARLAELASRDDRPRVRVVHGGADQVIPVEMSKDLAAGWTGWIEMEELPGVDHDAVIDAGFSRALDAIPGP